jgi:hypothetical protein
MVCDGRQISKSIIGNVEAISLSDIIREKNDVEWDRSHTLEKRRRRCGWEAEA